MLKNKKKRIFSGILFVLCLAPSPLKPPRPKRVKVQLTLTRYYRPDVHFFIIILFYILI